MSEDPPKTESESNGSSSDSFKALQVPQILISVEQTTRKGGSELAASVTESRHSNASSKRRKKKLTKKFSSVILSSMAPD